DRTFLRELCKYHISGQLRVAPEHISDNVLVRMGKPGNKVYREFVRLFEQMNKKSGKDQYIVPYLMSSHPGSTLKDAIALAEYIRELGYMPEQVQDFYPTPGTVSTCMYYTGLDPLTGSPAGAGAEYREGTAGNEQRKTAAGTKKTGAGMKPVYVPRDPHEKAMQRALIQYRDPANYELVKEALLREGRQDLIGFGEKCLIPPRKIEKAAKPMAARGRTRVPPGNNEKTGKETRKWKHSKKKY
ncbi:MAG: DUF3362 domain-containing protein, partial [Sarcina sp.]|nr:DUF3362 domain-containing protein [Sarcina sp.]